MATRAASNLILCYPFPRTLPLKPQTKMDDLLNASSDNEVSEESEDGFWSPSDEEGYTEEGYSNKCGSTNLSERNWLWTLKGKIIQPLS